MSKAEKVGEGIQMVIGAIFLLILAFMFLQSTFSDGSDRTSQRSTQTQDGRTYEDVMAERDIMNEIREEQASFGR